MAGNAGLFDGDDADDGDQNSAPSAFFDAVAAAGERKGVMGRPVGARNKKSVDFERWFYARGYRDPAQVLAEIMTMDPRALQQIALDDMKARGETKAVGTKEMPVEVVSVPSILDIVDLQRKAAVDLMPYLHGKKPNEIIVQDERLPTLIIVSDSNQLAEAQRILGQRQALSLGTVIEASNINDLEGGQ